MPYWDRGDYKTVTHNPLSSEVIAKLVTEEQVKKDLQLGKNPVKLSIEKWKKILSVHTILSKKTYPFIYYQDIFSYIGYKTCALCIDSIKKYSEEYGEVRNREDKCSVCPLKEIDRCIDDKSIYHRIESILSKKYDFGDSMKDTETLKAEFDDLKNYLNEMIKSLEKIK